MSFNNPDIWFLGIDLGTGSCKSVVIDPQGQVLGFGASGYVRVSGSSQWEEQNPESLVTSLLRSTRQAVLKARVSAAGCQGFSIGGAYHSLIAVDGSGKPLTGVMTWIDDRASAQAQFVRESYDPQVLYQQTGCPVHGMYPIYKVIWLREERPDVFNRAVRFISAKEYILERLCGEYLVDYSIAAGSGLLNTHDLNWNPDSLEIAGIKPHHLSQLSSPTQVIAEIKPDMAAEMGVLQGTPIVLGSADAVNSSLGAGAVRHGQATCMIGTSGAFRVIADEPVLDPQIRSWCYAIDQAHWLVGGAINNGGLALSWFRDLINQVPQFAGTENLLSFDDLIDLAGQVPPGADGLICLPYFAGERSPYWNMNARGVFFGLTLHHDIRHLARALLEGVAFRLRSLKDVLLEIGLNVDQVRASGGFTHSHLWPQIIANSMGRELLVPEWGETSSLGAAFWAMLGTGGIQRVEEVHDLVSIGKIYPFEPDIAAIYERYFHLYNSLYANVRDAFDEAAGLSL